MIKNGEVDSEFREIIELSVQKNGDDYIFEDPVKYKGYCPIL